MSLRKQIWFSDCWNNYCALHWGGNQIIHQYETYSILIKTVTQTAVNIIVIWTWRNVHCIWESTLHLFIQIYNICKAKSKQHKAGNESGENIYFSFCNGEAKITRQQPMRLLSLQQSKHKTKANPSLQQHYRKWLYFTAQCRPTRPFKASKKKKNSIFKMEFIY